MHNACSDACRYVRFSDMELDLAELEAALQQAMDFVEVAAFRRRSSGSIGVAAQPLAALEAE